MQNEQKVVANEQLPNQKESCNKKVADKKVTIQKRKSNEEFKRKYFDYYDDVKTNIKQDW